jgi:hypothetical protein
VIVVIGEVVGQETDDPRVDAVGLAASVARAAAAEGADVEVVARLGDDPTGDAVLLALARTGVGHVATIRDAGSRTPIRSIDEPVDPADDGKPDGAAHAVSGPMLDAADVGLALRYLTDYRVIVVLHPGDPGIVREAADAAGWAAAHLVVAVPPGSEPVDGLPDGTLTITADREAEGVAALLGRYAAAVDRGEEPAAAYAALSPGGA